MILSDRSIKELLEYEDGIVIDPYPGPEQLQPASVDLHIAPEIKKPIYNENYYPSDGWIMLNKPQRYVSCEIGENYICFPSKQFLLGRTVERIELPDDIVGRVEGRSSIGRSGLIVHATAGYIDPGFKGTITLEFYNLRDHPIYMPRNFRVCQIAFEKLDKPVERPYGCEGRDSKYMNQNEVQESLAYKDKELQCD